MNIDDKDDHVTIMDNVNEELDKYNLKFVPDDEFKTYVLKTVMDVKGRTAVPHTGEMDAGRWLKFVQRLKDKD